MLAFLVCGVALISLYVQYKSPLPWLWWAVAGLVILQWVLARALENTKAYDKGPTKFWTLAHWLSTVALIGAIVALYMQ